MSLLRIAAFGALGYAGYKFYESCCQNSGQRNGKDRDPSAFGRGQSHGENFSAVRDAGPHATADETENDWTKVDEASDQSFPASDPPANY